MFLKRLDPEDFTLTTDSVTSTCWSENITSLTSSSMYTSSINANGSGSYFWNIYNIDPNTATSTSSSNSIPQFAITYGNKYGSGSQFYNNGASNLSPTRTIYGQYRNLVLGNESSNFVFGNTILSDFYAITINRDRYKQSLLPGSLTLILSGSIPSSLGNEVIYNGNFASNTGPPSFTVNGWLINGTYDYINNRVQFGIAGGQITQNVFAGGPQGPGQYLIQFDYGGSTGVKDLTVDFGGSSTYIPTLNGSGTYNINVSIASATSISIYGTWDGWITNVSVKQILSTGNVLSLTDNSLITPTIQFCDAGRIFQLVSGSAGTVDYSQNSNGYTATGESYGWLLPDIGLILLNPNTLPFLTTRGYNTNNNNIQILYNAIIGGNNFTLNSQETISSNCVFVRAKSMDFNYSENPSFTSGSNAILTFDSMREHPQTFPTTIGLYNDTNDLVAVAKVSKPILKDFTTEALIKVKLDF